MKCSNGAHRKWCDHHLLKAVSQPSMVMSVPVVRMADLNAHDSKPQSQIHRLKPVVYDLLRLDN